MTLSAHALITQLKNPTTIFSSAPSLLSDELPRLDDQREVPAPTPNPLSPSLFPTDQQKNKKKRKDSSVTYISRRVKGIGLSPCDSVSGLHRPSVGKPSREPDQKRDSKGVKNSCRAQQRLNHKDL